MKRSSVAKDDFEESLDNDSPDQAGQYTESPDETLYESDPPSPADPLAVNMGDLDHAADASALDWAADSRKVPDAKLGVPHLVLLPGNRDAESRQRDHRGVALMNRKRSVRPPDASHAK